LLRQITEFRWILCLFELILSRVCHTSSS